MAPLTIQSPASPLMAELMKRQRDPLPRIPTMQPRWITPYNKSVSVDRLHALFPRLPKGNNVPGSGNL